MWERRHHAWDSPALDGRRMDLDIHGHAGARAIAFPTSQGSWHQWFDSGMCAALGDQLEGGALQLFCVSSVDDLSWYNESVAIHRRAEWQERYDRCLLDEVLPRSESVNGNPYLMVTGTSFGGYHALCFACRHPHLVNRVLSMSGLPDIKRLTDGFSDDLVYFYNPADFMRHEHEPARLAAFRRMDIILAVGRDDSLCHSNEEFSGTLVERGIGNALRIWDGWAHDWPWWRQMVRTYIGGHD
jgi:esterase/lipase superfamily enzyme